MTWATELTKLRRMLRDPTGTIWSDAFLRHLFNDVQQDFQHKTNVLEDVVVQRVPAVFQCSYLFDWEWRFLDSTNSQFYQALNLHDESCFCHSWEPQQTTGLTPDVSDEGVHFTQPWEAYMGLTPGDVIKMRFPPNFNEMKFCAYDEEPIVGTSKKRVQSTDPSYVTTEGTPLAYYAYDEVDNSYVLYPRPSVSFVQELAGDGVAMYEAGDTEDTTTGIIAVRDTDFDADVGVPIDVLDVTNSVLMVYTVSPTDIQTASDEPDYPEFMRKYIRHGVVSRAYGANTDGKIQSLSDYWAARYEMGVTIIKQYMLSKRNDRDYRMTTKGLTGRRNIRHPRLPDTYPAL